MSRSGTVQCSWCYQSGHNIRGCKQLRRSALEEGNAYAKRRLDRFEAANKKRSCSWCNEGGHNARTCQNKRTTLEWVRDTQTRWQRHLANYVREVSLGPGAIISHQPPRHRYYAPNGGECVSLVIGAVDFGSFVTTLCEPWVNRGWLFSVNLMHWSGDIPLPKGGINYTLRWDIPFVSAGDDVDFSVISPAAQEGVDNLAEHIMNRRDDADGAVHYLEEYGAGGAQALKNGLEFHNGNVSTQIHGPSKRSDLEYLLWKP